MAQRGRPRSFDRDLGLATALRLFWARGYEGTSITDLTEALGVNSPSLYAAFASKEALYREALDLYARTYGGYVAHALTGAPTARAAMESLLMAAAEAYVGEGEGGRGCLIACGLLSCGPAHQDLARDLAERRMTVQRAICGRLGHGIAAGELAGTTDIAALSGFYAAVLQGMSVQARDGASRAMLVAIARQAMAAWPGKDRGGDSAQP